MMRPSQCATYCNLTKHIQHQNPAHDLACKFQLSDNRITMFDTLPAIFPGHMAPIIKQSEDGARELVLRSGGLVLLRDGYAPKRVANTRDDKVHTKFWKDSFEKRRGAASRVTSLTTKAWAVVVWPLWAAS